MSGTPRNPLVEVFREGEAEYQAYGEIEIVSTFGQPEAEYAAIHKSCGLMDLPQRGVLELTGRDRLSFLNNLITNRTWDKQTKAGLEKGEAVYAFLLNNKGRVVADFNVIELGDTTWIDTDLRLIGTLKGILEKYVFTEQVSITDLSGARHTIALHGPGAAAVLEHAGMDVSALKGVGVGTSSARGTIMGVESVLWRDDPAAVPGYYVSIALDGVTKLWSSLMATFGVGETLGRRALRPVGWAAFNAARIEGGRGMFGIDFDDSILPAETGQFERAVNLTKGCYLGQEIVARMHARQQVAKKLVGLKMENDALPIAGTRIFDPQSNEIGGVTSSTFSPILSNTAIALGLLKRPFFELGTTVLIPAEGAMRKGTVVGTPFTAAEIG